MKRIGVFALLTLVAVASGPSMAQMRLAADCTPSTTLDVTANAAPDVDPALPGVQVRIGTNVQVSGVARVKTRSSTCLVTETLAPIVSWSLSFQPPNGGQIDVTNSLTPATTQTEILPSTTSFIATQVGTFSVMLTAESPSTDGARSAVVVVEAANEQSTACPAARQVVDIRGAGDLRNLIKTSVASANTLVRLGPDLDLDFSDKPATFFPISFGRCTTLTSVTSFEDATSASSPDAAGRPAVGVVPPLAGEARTPHSEGPVLRYGKSRDGAPTSDFLSINCDPFAIPNDGVRISGFRLYGPDFGYQKTFENGIHIGRCINIEISNMEIAGWGGAGIAVDDDLGPDQAPENNLPGGRIMNPEQILIHDNFIHNNQHPQSDGHAEGYGAVTGPGAWAKIYQNVFDLNRHSIAANGHTGGYRAEHNLVLKGGGYHGEWYETYTHSFDAHGTGCWWSSDLCGDAGIQFWILSNAWQYRKSNDIHIRGKPAINVNIDQNIFPFSNQDDAINLYTTDNVTVGPGNIYNVDTFGQYHVCDFDGDGVDDLFLATGASWWSSSFGEFQWSFLSAKTERLENLKFGYFEEDGRCDVLAERDGEWVISSGGVTDWKPFGTFGKPLSEVQFGRFDPNVRDHRPGARLRTTHAFWRRADGQWFVTPLSHPDWQAVASSGFPMIKLRFGSFGGFGNTDVLAVENGHWSISESAAGPWRTLNPTLSDPIENLYIANMDPDDNIDDILRLDQKVETSWSVGIEYQHVELTWWRSKNGTEPWKEWKSYVFDYPVVAEYVPVHFGFAGRFGAVQPGGGTMVIDALRNGNFFSSTEKGGASPDWKSLFPY
jgi:hypothetical protein